MGFIIAAGTIANGTYQFFSVEKWYIADTWEFDLSYLRSSQPDGNFKPFIKDDRLRFGEYYRVEFTPKINNNLLTRLLPA